MARAALLTFSDDATPEEIARALNSIRKVLKIPASTPQPNYFTDAQGGRRMKYTERPFRWSDIIQEYDPIHGEPCFYIP